MITVDILQKPQIGTKRFLEESRVAISDVVKAAAGAKLPPPVVRHRTDPKFSADVLLSALKAHPNREISGKAIAIGASTGG